MSRKTKILIVVIGLTMLLALFYWLFIRPQYPEASKRETPAANVNALPESPVAIPSANQNAASETKIPDADKLKTDLSRMASAFAERFGSYSNQGDFENILDLKPIMTEEMQQWADDFIERNRSAMGDTSVYSGVTAKAISMSITSLNEGVGQATIIVGVQKIENSGTLTGNEKVSYQDMELNFKKVGEEWRVDEAIWK
jgi:type II secretory pathway component PulM